jgi:hypothetical protein
LHSIAQAKRFRKECEPHPLTWLESLAGSQFDSEVVFGTDILIQAPDPKRAAAVYGGQLGFKMTDDNPRMITLHGDRINLHRPGPATGTSLGSDCG